MMGLELMFRCPPMEPDLLFELQVAMVMFVFLITMEIIGKELEMNFTGLNVEMLLVGLSIYLLTALESLLGHIIMTVNIEIIIIILVQRKTLVRSMLMNWLEILGHK